MYFSKVYVFKVYFCDVYFCEVCLASSKLCKFIIIILNTTCVNSHFPHSYRFKIHQVWQSFDILVHGYCIFTMPCTCEVVGGVWSVEQREVGGSRMAQLLPITKITPCYITSVCNASSSNITLLIKSGLYCQFWRNKTCCTISSCFPLSTDPQNGKNWNAMQRVISAVWCQTHFD